jgi:hypothetical protein
MGYELTSAGYDAPPAFLQAVLMTARAWVTPRVQNGQNDAERQDLVAEKLLAGFVRPRRVTASLPLKV